MRTGVSSCCPVVRCSRQYEIANVCPHTHTERETEGHKVNDKRYEEIREDTITAKTQKDTRVASTWHRHSHILWHLPLFCVLCCLALLLLLLLLLLAMSLAHKYYLPQQQPAPSPAPSLAPLLSWSSVNFPEKSTRSHN